MNIVDDATQSLQMAGIQLAMEQGKRLYRPKQFVDYQPSLVRMMEQRLFVNGYRDRPSVQASRDYTRRVLPASAYGHCPAACMPTRFFHTLQNKKKNGINSVVWTRDGRRLTTGSKNGDFTFWDAISMKYDTQIIPPDGKPIRSMAWSHDGRFMLSGCHGGIVQWWDPNLTPLSKVQAHESADGQHTVRDITWAPFDTKFGTCSDDKTIKIWDVKGKCELVMTGHRWDVKALDWHPTKPLLVSGSKDNSVKLWDARTGDCVNTFAGHKHTVLRTRWNPNGIWFASTGRDQVIMINDIRMMRAAEPFQIFKGHDSEVTSLCWHPQHERVVATGDMKGKICYWNVGNDECQHVVPFAHEGAVWDLAFHPIGHMLATCSHDTTVKIWIRPRTGESLAMREEGDAAIEMSQANVGEMSGAGSAGLMNLLSSSGSTNLSSGGGTSESDLARAMQARMVAMEVALSTRPKKPPPPGYICNICHTPGHFIQDCTQKQGPPSNYVCHLCNIPGHWKKECPKLRGGDR